MKHKTDVIQSSPPPVATVITYVDGMCNLTEGTVVVGTRAGGRQHTATPARRVSTAPQRILTTYLTSTPDPQRRAPVPPNDPARLLLLDGAHRLRVPVTVFHDQLSPEFCREHETDLIEFEQVEPCYYWSCNDYRFLVMLNWMIRHSGPSVSKDTAIFVSDMFDVRVNRDPQAVLNGQELVVGIHNDWRINDKSRNGMEICRQVSGWFKSVPAECQDQPILMAGSWGGRWGAVRKVLEAMVLEISHLNPGAYNCNLATFQRVLYRDFADVLTPMGAPFVSRFREYENDADVAFVHK